MADCTKCASANTCERVWKGAVNPTCVGYMPIRTNGDRIRQMPDEELAEWLYHLFDCTDCLEEHGYCRDNDGSCKRRWLDWLRKESG